MDERLLATSWWSPAAGGRAERTGNYPAQRYQVEGAEAVRGTNAVADLPERDPSTLPDGRLISEGADFKLSSRVGGVIQVQRNDVAAATIVAKADRVLTICTEAYVRKADDGKGGVGYEAMVVTGELVRDLGKNKFIPVVRQANPPAVRPRCVSTRLYVDFSEGADPEERPPAHAGWVTAGCVALGIGSGCQGELRTIHQRAEMVRPTVLVAGGFRRLFLFALASGHGQSLHPRPKAAPRAAILPRRIRPIPGKVRRGLRRTVCFQNARRIMGGGRRREIRGATKIALLTELKNSFGGGGFYKDIAPNGAAAGPAWAWRRVRPKWHMRENPKNESCDGLTPFRGQNPQTPATNMTISWVTPFKRECWGD
jgi:hypothetical protein